MKRSPIKRKQPRRSWSDAIRKVHREGMCRVCKSTSDLECAHTISRSRQDRNIPFDVFPLGESALRSTRTPRCHCAVAATRRMTLGS